MGRYAVDPVVLRHVDAQVEATVAHACAALAALEQMGQAIALSAHGYASTEEGVRSSMVTP